MMTTTELIIQMIEQGIILAPKFLDMWNTIKASFSTSDVAAIDAALEKAKVQDAADTVQADLDLDAASKQT